MSAVVKTVFRLNGQFLALGEELSRPAGLTAAWWQVLGTVLDEPLPVAGIARRVGLTRQSVQRVGDLLVERQLAEYLPNPAHRRAKLLRATEQGHAAVRRIRPAHAALADRLAKELGVEALGRVLDDLTRLSNALDEISRARIEAIDDKVAGQTAGSHRSSEALS
jgi:DNA-binding MarR family transcriptional regulator